MMKLKILELAEEKAFEQGVEQGIEQGIDLSAAIMLALIEKMPTEEIAERYNVSLEKIKQLQSILVQRTT